VAGDRSKRTALQLRARVMGVAVLEPFVSMGSRRRSGLAFEGARAQPPVSGGPSPILPQVQDGTLAPQPS
jgi:hypothetical protein